LKTAANKKLKKKIIVDAAGKTVYVYVPDGTSKTSKVPKALLAAWPPLTATAKNPKVGAGLSPSKLHVETQPDGKKQVSYNGHLLYLFSGDRSRGVANGQGLGKMWYVLSPSGALIKSD
jgi:predicted lipoprotein with Yx(FWY)xxD motif